jgi:hypothetical protein
MEKVGNNADSNFSTGCPIAALLLWVIGIPKKCHSC